MRGLSKILKQGIKVESEHKRTYNFLVSYVKRHRKMPPQKKFYSLITLDHVFEKGGQNYYRRLLKLKL